QGTGFDVVVITNAVDGDADRSHQASRLTTFRANARRWVSRASQARVAKDNRVSRSGARPACRVSADAEPPQRRRWRRDPTRRAMCTVDLYPATAVYYATLESHVRMRRRAGYARDVATLRFVVDPSGQFRQPFTRAAPLRRDDFGGHADCRLLRRTRTEIETD